ncbi:nuclear transport factor 2 family protein [Nocardia sp. alder85J]|uniref:nuclear transport factor 2 family protein n=1 Tax=Nocardia sp. alder85J TaxID=2862949 RepID=UPI001CD406E5|nr:nuclear transport factor 2 family protein [Nocardia sp. alder85J]MCX4095525.1 nuclear transport factor 2 family protein [Nocardia sp. alder85J]
MVTFDPEQAVSVIAIQQLVNEWAHELDVNNGIVGMGELVTEDVGYNVGGSLRNSRAEVLQFYKDRHARLEATEEGLPFHRHTLHNLRVDFTGEDTATIEFGLAYFTTAGVPAKQDHADPALLSDVFMAVRRGDDGHWRISRFDSAMTFRRVNG